MRSAMSKSWKLLQERLVAALKDKPHGVISDFCRRTKLSRSSVDGWLDDLNAPNVVKLDQIALGLNQKTWQVIQPNEDKSLIEKTIPFDIVEGLSKLSPEKQQQVFAQVRGLIALTSTDKEQIDKKKCSGS